MDTVKAGEIQKKIDSLDYWDARVLQVTCDYFGDEVVIAYDDDGERVIYKFIGCVRVYLNHDARYDKLLPSRQLAFPQIPYFLQDVTVKLDSIDGIELFVCSIDMFPLAVEVWCKDIQVVQSPQI